MTEASGKDTNLYEIGYLLKSGLPEKEVLAFSEKLRNMITEMAGLILSEGKAKQQTLAYPVKKEVKAVFNWIKFLLWPRSIQDFKKLLDKESSVLRFLIVKTTKEELAKPVIAKSKLSAPRGRPLRLVGDEARDLTLGGRKEEIIKKKTQREDTEKKSSMQVEEIDKKLEEILGE